MFSAINNYALAQRKLEQQRRMRKMALAFNQKYSQLK